VPYRPQRTTCLPRAGARRRLASRPRMPSKVFKPGLLDGAPDNWFGPGPPGGPTEEGGKPLAEERRSES
jgi:hypothetical protein